jgi:acyl carrier protein
MDIKNQIIDCAERAGVMLDNDACNVDIDLREHIEDSLQFISFIIEIENELGLEIPPDMLLFDNLASIDSFCCMLNELSENQN